MVDALQELPLFDDYVKLHARRTPDALAISCLDYELTYRELGDRVAAYAAAFAASGIGPRDVVAVFGYSRPECLIAFGACCRIGAVYLGLNPKYTVPELAFVVGDSRPRLLLAMHSSDEPEQNEKLRSALAMVDSIGEVVTRHIWSTFKIGLDEFLARGSAHAPPDAVDAGSNDACAIVYTSGSTGAPKGALLSQRGIIRSAMLTLRFWFGVDSEIRTVAQHPINHVGWLVCECMTVLIAGGSLFFRERFDGAATLRLIDEQRLNVWVAFPSMVILAMRTPEFEASDLSSLKRLAFGSLPSMEILSRLRERTDAVFSVSYGLTEASGGAVTASDDDAEPAAIADTIGRPVPGVEVRIVDTDYEDVAPGAAGELLVRDSCVFLGYLNRPDATAAAIDSEGWLHTGDVVAREPDGNLRLVGRLKEMFKSGGYNVYPSEVESVISSSDAVRAVAVVAAPDPLWSEIGVAFVVLNSEVDPEVEERLRKHARAGLANYKVPKRFIVVDELPQLPSGKFDKLRLRERAAREHKSIA